jgi:hypothetical protein
MEARHTDIDLALFRNAVAIQLEHDAQALRDSGDEQAAARLQELGDAVRSTDAGALQHLAESSGWSPESASEIQVSAAGLDLLERTLASDAPAVGDSLVGLDRADGDAFSRGAGPNWRLIRESSVAESLRACVISGPGDLLTWEVNAAVELDGVPVELTGRGGDPEMAAAALVQLVRQHAPERLGASPAEHADGSSLDRRRS